MGDRLATIDKGRKVGWGYYAPFVTELGPQHNVASWSIQPFGHDTPTLQIWQTYRKDNGPVAYGEPLLVTVRPMNCQYHSRRWREMRSSKLWLRSQRVQCRMNVTGWRRRVFGSHECIDAWQ